MNKSNFPHLHADHGTTHDDGSPQAAPAVDRNTFIANLNRIGSGAAADGQPWPERHQLPGRCLALADADWALCSAIDSSSWRLWPQHWSMGALRRARPGLK